MICYQAFTNMHFSFAYNMNGLGIGALEVEVSIDGGLNSGMALITTLIHIIGECTKMFLVFWQGRFCFRLKRISKKETFYHCDTIEHEHEHEH